jgi:hypothetical protein
MNTTVWTTLCYNHFHEVGIKDVDNFIPFIQEVHSLYNETLKFHNHQHVIQVLKLGISILVSNKKLLRKLTQSQLITYSIGLLCHDLDHIGINNQEIESNPFELSNRSANIELPDDMSDISDSDISSISTTSYNEIHHMHMTKLLLKKHSIEYDKDLLRKMIIYTDISLQEQFIENFNKCLYKKGIIFKRLKTPVDMQLVLLTKIADIGHILQPWNIHEQQVYNFMCERKLMLTSKELANDTIHFNTSYTYPLLAFLKLLRFKIYKSLINAYKTNMLIWKNKM